MNSSYEWQKLESNRRPDEYRRQAEAHRQSKGLGNKGEHSTAIGKTGFAVAVGILLVAIGYMMSG